MRELKLSAFGLETVAAACARKGWAAKTVQNWVKAGLIPAVVVGAARGTYLLRTADVDAFVAPKRGPATGTKYRKRQPPKPKPKPPSL